MKKKKSSELVQETITLHLDSIRQKIDSAESKSLPPAVCKDLNEEFQIWSRLLGILNTQQGNSFEGREQRFLRYLDTKNMDERVLDTCEGDIRIMVDTLADYANILEEKTEEKDGYQAAIYSDRVRRIRKIQKNLEDFSGYCWKLQKCCCEKKANKDDIGEEALALTLAKGTKKVR